MQDYRIIYPKGDRSKLKVVLMFDYEEHEWALASRRSFAQDEQDEACEYAAELAQKHGLQFLDERPGQHDYLD